MAAEIGWASLGIVPTLDKGFDSKLSRSLDPAMSSVGKKSGLRLGSFLGKSAVAGAAGIIAAGFAAFKLGKDSVAEAREAQEIGATSAAILKSTQHAAKLSRGEYDKLTASLMAKTAIDDEQIAQGGNLLLTFKNVKREGKGLKDIFGRALASSLDLTAAGFGSIESMSKQLGKALNDPIKGMAALSKSGVTFTADQQEQIKALVETGDLLGAQKIILKEVESQVGGTAAAQKTSSKELETAYGNLKEEIGGALIPVLDDAADVINDKVIPAGHDFSDWLKDDGIPQAKDLGQKLRPLAEELLPAAGDALGTVRDFAKDALPYVEDLVGAFNDMPDWAKKAVVGGALGALAASKTGLIGGKSGALSGLVANRGSTPANALFVTVTNPSLGGTPTTGPGGVVTTPDGKDPKTGKKPRKTPKGLKGAGTFVASALVTLFGDDLVEEGKAELLYPWSSQGRKPTLTAGSNTPLADLPISKYENEIRRMEEGESPLTSWVDDLEKEIHDLQIRKIQPRFDVLGLIEAEAKVAAFAQRASRPIRIPLIVDDQGLTHATTGGHEAAVPGESASRRGGVHINIERLTPYDHRGMVNDLQRRAQQAALGGRPAA